MPSFDVTMTWEYTFTPSHQTQKFACVSDRNEFHQLLQDGPSTRAWYMTQRPGLKTTSKSAFELISYSVNGQTRPIRRTERKTGQTYTVDLGEDAMATDQPIRVRHTSRTVTRKAGHRLQAAVTQPTRNLTVTIDYTDTDIAELRVTDLVSGARRAQIEYLPAEAPARVINLEVPGWLLPQAEVTFVWTLTCELPATSSQDEH